jgi:hypothetical protein
MHLTDNFSISQISMGKQNGDKKLIFNLAWPRASFVGHEDGMKDGCSGSFDGEKVPGNRVELNLTIGNEYWAWQMVV